MWDQCLFSIFAIGTFYFIVDFFPFARAGNFSAQFFSLYIRARYFIFNFENIDLIMNHFIFFSLIFLQDNNLDNNLSHDIKHDDNVEDGGSKIVV